MKQIWKRCLCALLLLALLPLQVFAVEELPEAYAQNQGEGSFLLSEDSRFYFVSSEAPEDPETLLLIA